LLLLVFHHLLKSPIVVEDGLRELEQALEQIPGAREFDLQLARLQVDPGRQTGQPAIADILSRGNLDFFARRELPVARQILREPAAPAVLLAKFLAALDPFELLNQSQAAGEEGFAGLETGEGLEEVDGLAPPDLEEFFHHRAVDNGGG
jgi:hypothetical protein